MVCISTFAGFALNCALRRGRGARIASVVPLQDWIQIFVRVFELYSYELYSYNTSVVMGRAPKVPLICVKINLVNAPDFNSMLTFAFCI